MIFSRWDALEEQGEMKLFSQDVFSLSQKLLMLQVVYSQQLKVVSSVVYLSENCCPISL